VVIIGIEHVPKSIQIRNVPDHIHEILKERAAHEGMSLSAYLLAEITRSAEVLTIREMRVRLQKRTAVELSVSPADVIRAQRGV